MKALMKTAFDEPLSLRDIEEPAVTTGSVKIKIHACGICASDIHIMHNTYASIPPVVMGHEYSGTVVEVGEGVEDFRVGDRVVSLTAITTCESCEYCYEGLRMLCADRRSIGSGQNGAFTSYLTVPAKFTFHVPENVSLDAAALSEPLACAVRGVLERTVIKAGDMILVSGAGIIGQLTAQLAKANGGIVVMAGMDVDLKRLEKAKELGAYDFINLDQENFMEAVDRLTDGRGFDAAFECAGAAPSADNCIKALKKTGNYTQVGLFGKAVPFDHDLALKKELNISNSYASERTSWERAMRILKYELIEIEPFVGSKLPLSKWEEGFQRVVDKSDFKVLLVPEE